MQNRIISSLIVGSLLLFGRSAAAQSWERYQPGTLGDIVQQETAELLEFSGDTSLPGRAYGRVIAVRAVLFFSGSTRPITPGTKAFLGSWLRTRGLSAGEAEHFTEEWLFLEDGQEYWIPVQAETSASMRGSVRAGDSITAYALYIGAERGRGSSDWRCIFILSAAAS